MSGINIVGRVVVASVGLTWNAVARALGRVGLGEGDVVLLFNSVPRVAEAEQAMERLERWIKETYGGSILVESYWLDPRLGFEEAVATIRRSVEKYAPCRVSFVIAGGFRWLGLAVAFAAFAAYTLSQFTGVVVESLELELEEDIRAGGAVKQLFPTQESRVVRIPVLLKLVDISYGDIQVLREAARTPARARLLAEKLNIPIATLQRKLTTLTRKGLLTNEKKGRTYIYYPTKLAKMLL